MGFSLESPINYNEVVEEKGDLYRGIKILHDAVKSTYGPNGNTIILHDAFNNAFATKDGVSIAKKISFKDPVMNAGAQLIKQAAEKTLEEAGDGTSGSIILAYELINKGIDIYGTKPLTRENLDQLDYIRDLIINDIDKLKAPIKEDQVFKVAKIASNGDEVIADLITKAFSHSENVKVIEGDNFKDKLETVKGMKLRTTYFDSAFINNISKKSAEYNNCNVIILDGKLTSMDSIKDLISNENPTVIIAEHFEDIPLGLLKYNYNKGIIKVLPIKAPGVGSHRKNLLKDMAVYTGATVLNPNKINSNPRLVGTLNSIEVFKDEAILYKEITNKKVSELIKELETYRNSDVDSHEKELASQRIEGLSANSSMIKIGGDSPAEIKERFDRVDDAVRAVECAKKDGIIAGGGITLNVLATTYKKDSPYAEVFSIPFKILKPNLDEAPLDPAKVIKTSVKNAVSVAKTILSTSHIVLNESQWKIL